MRTAREKRIADRGRMQRFADRLSLRKIVDSIADNCAEGLVRGVTPEPRTATTFILEPSEHDPYEGIPEQYVYQGSRKVDSFIPDPGSGSY